jgi:serine/threonine protein kinase
LPDTVFSGFRIRRLIGQGTMGAVYLAADPERGVDVALKVMNADLLADAKAKRRFADEARIGTRIASAHVVSVLGAGVDEASELPYLVMDYVSGRDLASFLAERAPLSREDALAILRGIFDAVAAAHAVNVVHRDLKTENVIVTENDGRPRARVLDFGIAKIITGATMRGTSSGLGTPVWTAPEQSDPEIPARPPADVWSMGLLAFEVLVGKSYWKSVADPKSSAYDVALEILKSPIGPASERAALYDRADRLPEGFDGWFSRSVCRDPAGRFADGREAQRAFEALFAESIVPAPKPRVWLALVTGAVVLGAAVAALLLR